MKIDNLNMEELMNIEFNYDNLDLLKVIKYFIGVVINDIECINDTSDINNEEIQFLDLGNNTKIKKEDLESLYSCIDTIYFIGKYNEKEQENE